MGAPSGTTGFHRRTSMHAVWKKLAEWIEKDVPETAIKLKYNQEAQRGVIIIALLIAVGFIALTGLLINHYGSYCEYPDPYGR
jgi:hypothetical protein